MNSTNSQIEKKHSSPVGCKARAKPELRIPVTHGNGSKSFDVSKDPGHYCYCLFSPSTKRTYVGYTVNPIRRLRQHNGLIKGGAKRTKKGRPWVMVFYVSGFPDHRTGLQFEWRHNHPSLGVRIPGLSRKTSLVGRIKNFHILLACEQWTSTSPHMSTLNLCVHWQLRKITLNFPFYNLENKWNVKQIHPCKLRLIKRV